MPLPRSSVAPKDRAADAGRNVAEIGADGLPTKTVVQRALERRFFLRLHMTVILGFTFATGLVATKLLLAAHLHNMAWRYGLVVCFSFGAFLAAIKIWLAYVGWCASSDRRARSHGDSSLDWFDCIDFGSDGVEVPSLNSGGGSFGGGGSTASWGTPDTPVMIPARLGSMSTGGGKSSGWGKFDLDLGDDFGLILVVILLVVVIALAAFYVIYAAPAILAEAGFQAALAGALARRAKRISTTGWVGSVFKATVLPFLGVLVMAVAVGWLAHDHCPTATRLREALSCSSTAPR